MTHESKSCVLLLSLFEYDMTIHSCCSHVIDDSEKPSAKDPAYHESVLLNTPIQAELVSEDEFVVPPGTGTAPPPAYVPQQTNTQTPHNTFRPEDHPATATPIPPPTAPHNPGLVGNLGRDPVGLKCQYCHEEMVTRPSDQIDAVTIMIAILLCKKTEHYCSRCNRKVGETEASSRVVNLQERQQLRQPRRYGKRELVANFKTYAQQQASDYFFQSRERKPVRGTDPPNDI
eukprot:scaffold174465_cov52-Attheya_sp.AAC.2